MGVNYASVVERSARRVGYLDYVIDHHVKALVSANLNQPSTVVYRVMSVKHVAPAFDSGKIHLSGRWITDSGSISTSWAGSSVSFLFTGASLELLCGENTERKDRWNGGVPMIGVSIAAVTEYSNQHNWNTYDARAGMRLDLLKARENIVGPFLVCIMMIDWASTLEVQALILDQDANIVRTPVTADSQILYIGDSITCGYFAQPEGTPIPGPEARGCLDAFPYVAQRVLAQYEPAQHIQVEMIAYPGWALVSLSDEEKLEGNPSGMLEKYFQASPWSSDQFQYPHHSPIAIVIELGTNDQDYYSVERYELCLHNFIDKLLEGLASLPRYIWMIPPFSDGGQPTELQRAFPKLVDQLGTKLQDRVAVELCNIGSELTPKDTIDGIHPSIEGHVKLGTRLACFIRTRHAGLR